MATNSAPLSVAASRSLGLTLGGSGGSASGSGIDVSWTGKAIGDTLTITTSTLDFTAKTNAKPFWYVDPGAEGVLTASPLSRKTVSLAGTDLGTLDEITKYGPGGAAVASKTSSSPSWLVDSGTIGPSLGTLKTNADGAGDHIRVASRYRRNVDGLDAYAKWQALNPGASAWNIKRWRWWSETNPTTKNDLVVALGQANTESGDIRVTPENSASGTLYYGGKVTDPALFGMKKNAWVSEFLEMRQSSAAGVPDARFRHIADGDEFLYDNFVSYDNDGNDSRYVDFVMEQWQFIYADTPFELWHDFIYLDDTPHAIVVTSGATWGTEGVTIDPVVPTTWGSTSITAQARCALEGKYLYVFDGTGALLNTTGVPL